MCAGAMETFGFDAAIDHRAHDEKSPCARGGDVAPDGVDIYFENVGGKVLHTTFCP